MIAIIIFLQRRFQAMQKLNFFENQLLIFQKKFQNFWWLTLWSLLKKFVRCWKFSKNNFWILKIDFDKKFPKIFWKFFFLLFWGFSRKFSSKLFILKEKIKNVFFVFFAFFKFSGNAKLNFFRLDEKIKKNIVEKFKNRFCVCFFFVLKKFKKTFGEFRRCG